MGGGVDDRTDGLLAETAQGGAGSAEDPPDALGLREGGADFRLERCAVVEGCAVVERCTAIEGCAQQVIPRVAARCAPARRTGVEDDQQGHGFTLRRETGRESVGDPTAK